MKEITDRLETGIQQLFDSDRYKAYLTTMAKFHNYSFNNTLLIAMQGGQLVAGFNKWKDTFHHRKEGRKRHQDSCSCALQGQAEDGKAGRTGQADSG